MGRTIMYAVAALVVVVGVAAGVVRLRQRARGVAADIALIRGDTGDVMASATYQRFAQRRQGVVAMRAALLDVARAESVWVADSGRPTTRLQRSDITYDANKVYVWISLLGDRWVAAAADHSSSTMPSTMTCMITAMLDTVTSRYHPGAPVCAEAYFQDTIAAMVSRPPR